MEETLGRVEAAIRERRSIQHGCVDAGKLALMFRDPDLYRSVTESDLINGEGQVLVWLSRLKAVRLPERVVGLELFERLVEFAHRKGHRVYLLGARQAVVQRVVEMFSERYSPGVIAGWRNGYFEDQDGVAVAREIAACRPDMLFVAIRSPLKEKFLSRHAAVLRDVPFRMGVGGSFDVVAGRVKRAPRWVQAAGFEWLYRFLQEPRDKWKVEVVDSFDFLWLSARYAVGLARRKT